MNIQDMYRLSAVHRWHIVSVAKPQSVAEHSYFVMLLVWEILPFTDCSSIEDVFWAVSHSLWHDAAEAFTGDIPGPVKHAIDREKLKDLEAKCLGSRADKALSPPEHIKDLVKLCDMAEAYKFLLKFGGSDHAIVVAQHRADELEEYFEAMKEKYPSWAWDQIEHTFKELFGGAETTLDDIVQERVTVGGGLP